jgi:hypothetical protein
MARISTREQIKERKLINQLLDNALQSNDLDLKMEVMNQAIKYELMRPKAKEPKSKLNPWELLTRERPKPLLKEKSKRSDIYKPVSQMNQTLKDPQSQNEEENPDQEGTLPEL